MESDRNDDAAVCDRELEPQYLAFFDCFNRHQFFEAHDVLEELWLRERNTAEDLFYKGLIQLAGAFVHVQKGHSGPAIGLLMLARSNLQKYPAVHKRLHVREVLGRVEEWLEAVRRGSSAELLVPATSPRLILRP
jgi:predicted metal-dependent hydrolase